MWTLIKPYDDSVPTPSPLRPDAVEVTPSDSVPPLQGDEDGDAVNGTDSEHPTPSQRIDVNDPAVQALLNDDIPF